VGGEAALVEFLDQTGTLIIRLRRYPRQSNTSNIRWSSGIAVAGSAGGLLRARVGAVWGMGSVEVLRCLVEGVETAWTEGRQVYGADPDAPPF
jgi:hypothetical protein